MIALVGNKYDLAEDQREVPEEEAAALALSQECLYFETSAKTSHNIHALFLAVAKAIPRSQGGDATQQASEPILIGTSSSVPVSDLGCC